MNECEECEVDPRPNLFDEPLTNWAHLELDGWKIHHTTQVNWARNVEVDIINWQFSARFRNRIFIVHLNPMIQFRGEK